MKDPQNLADHANEVIQEIQRRREWISRGEPLTLQSTKLGLVVEGGGMRGVISGGALMALERLGLGQAFDNIYGESAGAINASYFLAGQAEFGSSIYREELSSKKFIDLFRIGKILDVDYAIDKVVGESKYLDCEKAIGTRSDLFVSLTDTSRGQRRVVNVKKEAVPLLTLLKATSAIIPLYNHAVMIDGVPYADGGITDPIPVRNAIDDGCTHILVLLTRAPDFQPQPFSRWERFVLDRFLAGWNREFIDAFYSRWQRTRETRDVALGRAPVEVKISVICPASDSPRVGRLTTNRQALDLAMDDGFRRTMRLFDQ